MRERHKTDFLFSVAHCYAMLAHALTLALARCAGCWLHVLRHVATASCKPDVYGYVWYGILDSLRVLGRHAMLLPDWRTKR
jgi:hypothetical protein